MCLEQLIYWSPASSFLPSSRIGWSPWLPPVNEGQEVQFLGPVIVSGIARGPIHPHRMGGKRKDTNSEREKIKCALWNDIFSRLIEKKINVMFCTQMNNFVWHSYY